MWVRVKIVRVKIKFANCDLGQMSKSPKKSPIRSHNLFRMKMDFSSIAQRQFGEHKKQCISNIAVVDLYREASLQKL